MRTQTMATQDGGDAQPLEIHSLARQDSIYSFTLSGVQSHQGEPLQHRMNLDELLKNVPPVKSNPSPSLLMDIDGGCSSRHSGLRRVGGTATPQAPNKKTADEVWRDIQQGTKKKNKGNGEQQPAAHGEMTLEDFLVKAGVAAEGSDNIRIDHIGSIGFMPYAHWLQQYHCHHQQQHQYYHHHQQLQPLVAGAGATLDAMYSDSQGNAPSPVPGAVSDPQTPGPKRAAAEDVSGKTVERRKKRMIKNRESAARSRARKQAYTNELVNKISLLEAENEKLKKQKELASVIHIPQPEPKYKLRRTRSVPF